MVKSLCINSKSLLEYFERFFFIFLLSVFLSMSKGNLFWSNILLQISFHILFFLFFWWWVLSLVHLWIISDDDFFSLHLLSLLYHLLILDDVFVQLRGSFVLFSSQNQFLQRSFHNLGLTFYFGYRLFLHAILREIWQKCCIPTPIWTEHAYNPADIFNISYRWTASMRRGRQLIVFL